MTSKRIYQRIKFHIQKKVIISISYLDHRLYMKFYIPLLRRQGMKFTGLPRYIGAHVKFDDFPLISMGNRVVISDWCHFLTHDYSITTAMLANGEKVEKDFALIRGITVGNNIFIGAKTIVMPGTNIGDNVIIGAGSVIRGNIEANSIYAGNPAKKIKSIDSQVEKWKKLIETETIRTDK